MTVITWQRWQHWQQLPTYGILLPWVSQCNETLIYRHICASMCAMCMLILGVLRCPVYKWVWWWGRAPHRSTTPSLPHCHLFHTLTDYTVPKMSSCLRYSLVCWDVWFIFCVSILLLSSSVPSVDPKSSLWTCEPPRECRKCGRWQMLLADILRIFWRADILRIAPVDRKPSPTSPPHLQTARYTLPIPTMANTCWALSLLCAHFMLAILFKTWFPENCNLFWLLKQK